MPVNKPLDVELGNVTEANAAQLKTLNMIALPVRYTDKFYKELIAKTPEEFLKFAFWNGFAVGSVCSRLEPQEGDTNKIYIMTIGVIPAYRRRGIASKLLEHIMENARKDRSVREVYLHVQTSNESARDFYLSHGFENVGVAANYYTRVEPPDAFILRKAVVREQAQEEELAGVVEEKS